MLLLFSASLLILLSPLLLAFLPPALLSTSCGTACSSSIEMVYWCQVVNLLSLICTGPVVFRGSAHFLPPPPLTRQKTQVDNLWRFGGFCQEPPRVRQMSRLLSMMFSLFLFKVLKVSFDRTLVVELTPETLSQTTAFPLWAMSRRLRFSLAFHDISWVLNLAKPSAVEQCPRDYRVTYWNVTKSTLAHVQPQKDKPKKLKRIPSVLSV